MTTRAFTILAALCALAACTGGGGTHDGSAEVDGAEVTPEAQVLAMEAGQVLRVSPRLAWTHDPTSRMLARLTPEGVRLESVDEDGWAVRMRLEAWGRPGALAPARPGALEVDGARTTLTADGVAEWYEGGEQGLMHGFTVEREPGGEGEGLRLEVSVEGAEVSGAGPRALVFTVGEESVRYERLLAWDATGRLLDASMRPSSGGFVLDVETPDGLAYPLTVDPTFTRTVEIDGVDGRDVMVASNDRFGQSVAIDGDLMVIGAPFDDQFGQDAGAFYTYRWDPSAGWVYVSKQTIQGTQANDNVGWDVALDGLHLVVGAPGRLGSDGGIGTFPRGGRFSVYERPGLTGPWIHVRTFEDIVGWDDNELGKSVAIKHPHAFGGAPGADVFEGGNPVGLIGSVWVLNYVDYAIGRLETRGLTADGAELGTSLAVGDDILYAGAPGDDLSGFNLDDSGAVYFWRKDPNEFGDLGWGVPAAAPNPNSFFTSSYRTNGRFGTSLDAKGVDVVVGEPGVLPGPGNPPSTLTGRVHHYRLNPVGTIGLRQELDDTITSTNFGASVAIAGDQLLVGAPGASGGKVQPYARLSPNDPWTITQAALTLPGGVMGDGFGVSAALSGDRAVVGAPGRAWSGATKAGLGYVVEVDDPPVPPATFTRTTPEDTPVDVTVTASDPDTVDSTLVYAFTNQPPNGTIVIAGDVITYTPDADFSGADVITYTVSDRTSTVTATVDVNVTAVNDPPAAQPQTVAVDEDSSVSVFLTASDPDGPSLVFTLVDQGGGVVAPNGSVNGNPPNVTYIPDPGYSGTDAFTFRVTDGTSTSSATITLDVQPVNDPPAVADVDVTTAEDTEVEVTLSAVDEDTEASALTFGLVTNQGTGRVAANGDVALVGDRVTYTPSQDFNGEDSFEYTVTDGEFTETATVTVTVTPVNDPPLATPAAYGDLVEDTRYELTLGASDPDNEPSLNYVVSTQPEHGVVNADAFPLVTYTPDVNYFGSDSFEFTVSDGDATSAAARVDLTIAPVNDAPVAIDQPVEVDEDGDVSVVFEGMDVEGDALEFSLRDLPENGTAVASGLVGAVYTPDEDFNGTDTFTFVVNDGELESELGTITVTVNPVNDLPTVRDLTIRTPAGEPVQITLDGRDVDGDELTYIVSEPTRGAITAQDGDVVTFDPGAFVGQVTFTYTVDDGQEEAEEPATVTITVGVVGDAPRERPDLVSCAAAPGRAPGGLAHVALALLGLLALARRRASV